jgi:membrane associated rhomboid family serine protease
MGYNRRSPQKEDRLIPMRDLNPTRRFPIVTVALIIANVLVFAYQLLLPSAGAMDVLSPRLGGRSLQPDPRD